MPPLPPSWNLIIVLIIQNKESVAVKDRRKKEDEQLVLEAVMVSFKNEYLHFRKTRTKGISMFLT